MTALDRMRASTAGHHQDLEDRLDLIRRIASPQGRRTMVVGFHSLHAGAEAGLSPWLADLAGLDFEARRRTPHLARDLAALGVTAQAPCPFPAPRNEGEALGLFYVLEGSTLGGAVIRKALAGRGEDMTGLSFLHPHGERTGVMWRAFTGLLEARAQALGDGAADAMAAGAVLGFETTRDWLCREEAAA